jgi:hypothetical protein
VWTIVILVTVPSLILGRNTWSRPLSGHTRSGKIIHVVFVFIVVLLCQAFPIYASHHWWWSLLWWVVPLGP